MIAGGLFGLIYAGIILEEKIEAKKEAERERRKFEFLEERIKYLENQKKLNNIQPNNFQKNITK